MVFLAGKSPNIRSHRVYIYGSGQPYLYPCAGRRSSKVVSLLVSCFSANYVRHWPAHFGEQPLCATPMFDGRYEVVVHA
jgi:tRNA(His) 5'-end guanylyltransferase